MAQCSVAKSGTDPNWVLDLDSEFARAHHGGVRCLRHDAVSAPQAEHIFLTCLARAACAIRQPLALTRAYLATLRDLAREIERA
jgi:hypothetical protein